MEETVSAVTAGHMTGNDKRAAAAARAALLARLENQPVMEAGRWLRDELYEDDR